MHHKLEINKCSLGVKCVVSTMWACVWVGWLLCFVAWMSDECVGGCVAMMNKDCNKYFGATSLCVMYNFLNTLDIEK